MCAKTWTTRPGPPALQLGKSMHVAPLKWTTRNTIPTGAETCPACRFPEGVVRQAVDFADQDATHRRARQACPHPGRTGELNWWRPHWGRRRSLCTPCSRNWTWSGRIWKIEDSKRDAERQQRFDPALIALAREVYNRNDERAAIKRAISVLLGSALLVG